MTRTGATLAGPPVGYEIPRDPVRPGGPMWKRSAFPQQPAISLSPRVHHCATLTDRCPIDVGKMQSSAGYNSWVGGRVDRSSATALTRVDWRYSLSLAFFGVSETSDHPSKEARSRDHDDKHDSLGELSRVASNATWGVFPFGGRRENPVGVTPQLGGKTKVV